MVEKSADILMPGPDGPAVARRPPTRPAATDSEAALAGILADVVHAERISPTATSSTTSAPTPW